MIDKQPLPGLEEEALLRLSGLKPLLGAAEALPAVTNPWRFVWLANEHGVCAFVQRNMQALKMAGILPPGECQWLRNMAFKAMIRNSFITDAMTKAAAILNEEGIVPVLIKGIALEQTVYEGRGLRPTTDADIVLPADECLKAWELLLENGFTAAPQKSRLHRKILMHTGKHLPLLQKGGFSLEIHHSLFDGKNERFTAIMLNESREIKTSSPKPMNYGDLIPCEGEPPDLGKHTEATEEPVEARVGIPPPALHLLCLVNQLGKFEEEGSSQLRFYNDLAAMIAYYGAEETISRALMYASSTPLSGMLKDKLALLHRYMEVELPPEYYFVPTQRAESEFLTSLAKPRETVPPDKKAAYRKTLKSVNGSHRKCLYLLGDIFPSVSYMKSRYGKKSAFAVLPRYLVRSGRLFRLI